MLGTFLGLAASSSEAGLTIWSAHSWIFFQLAASDELPRNEDHAS
jgi:hypothetical protein